jgi:hypothetical protein
LPRIGQPHQRDRTVAAGNDCLQGGGLAMTSTNAGLPPVGIRWTMGDASERGYDALRLSIWGAWRIFGPAASYVVCVHSVPVDVARSRTGPVPAALTWHDATRDVPAFLRAVLGNGMAQGAGWKLAPLRCFPFRHELSLDNDCILWSLPPSLQQWLAQPRSQAGCVLAEDVQSCYGQFAAECPRRPLNAGLRALPPRFDPGPPLREALARRQRDVSTPLAFTCEPDEEGLQAAALSLAGPLHAVPLEEVTVCSPFPPHLPHLGSCGAHFIGLSARTPDGESGGNRADTSMAEHWKRHAGDLRARTGAPARFELAGLASV